jgi:hypothetical protein
MKCFLSGSVDNLSKINVDDADYYFDEEKYSDLSVKSIKEEIRKKRDESANKVTIMAEAFKIEAQKYGISLDDFIKQLTNGEIDISKINADKARSESVKTNPSDAPTVKLPAIKQPPVDDGFKSVTGELVSPTANFTAEEGISGAMPAHQTPTINGKRIVEEDKQVKKVGNVLITRSKNLGETRIAINSVDAADFNKRMNATTPDYELVNSHKNRRECPLCHGSGIHRDSVCPKCKGSGLILTS